jgi:DNA-directed RNA polymerase subunit M/transcription elongation factor TFIIS
MSTVKFNCPHCQQRLGVPDSLLGRKLSCPTCGGHIRLPEKSPAPDQSLLASLPPEQPPLPSAIPVEKPKALGTTVPVTLANGDITFFCPRCDSKLVVTERAAGKQIPCRSCGSPIKVPDAAIPPDPAGRETINLTARQEGHVSLRDLVGRVSDGDVQAAKTVLAFGSNAVAELLGALEQSFDEPKENRGADRVTDVLVRIGHPSVKPLIAKLGKSRRAYFALGRIGSEEALGALVRELTSVNWRRVEAACIGLGLVENPEALYVINHLENTRKNTRVGEVYAAAGAAIAALQRRFTT